MSDKRFHIAVPVYGLLVYQPLCLVFVSKKWVVNVYTYTEMNILVFLSNSQEI